MEPATSEFRSYHRTKLQELKKHLRSGKIYRRKGLAQWSSSVDRHLQQPLAKLPDDAINLIETFLKDNRYLVTSRNAITALVKILVMTYCDRFLKPTGSS